MTPVVTLSGVSHCHCLLILYFFQLFPLFACFSFAKKGGDVTSGQWLQQAHGVGNKAVRVLYIRHLVCVVPLP